MNGSMTHLAAMPPADPPDTPPDPDASRSETGEAGSGISRSPSRPRPLHAMPTDRMKRPLQRDVLRAYGVLGRNGEGVDGAKLRAHIPNVSEATLGLNNGFFMEMGLIERVSKGVYRPVPAVVEFARVYSFDADAAGGELAPVLSGSWAAEAVRSKLSMGPCTTTDMIRCLAVTAKADASFTAQLRTLLEWLEYGGIIRFDGDMVTLVDTTPLAAAAGAGGAGPTGGDGGGHTPPADPAVPKPTKEKRQEADPSPVVALNLSVTITAADLSRLTPEQIRALFEGVGSVAAIQAALGS